MTALKRSPDLMRARPLVLTQGDPSGIGPEIASAAYRAARADSALPPFAVFGDPALLRRSAERLGEKLDIAILADDELERAAAIFPQALPVVAVGAPACGAPGHPDASDAAAVIDMIEQATHAVMAGRARGLVTNPISKKILYAAGFAHPGHTEFLAALASAGRQRAFRPVMMLHCAELAVVPATIHVPFAQVPHLLTQDLLVETAEIVARDLRLRFGVARPRLAFSGLNPHAGEGGAIGREEIEIISPAIQTLAQTGMDAAGPYPADALFHAAARARYDAAICMTHDQALIPIKTIAFDRAVNVTCGLPFVRTSPDHGVAYDIAGQGRADPSSLIAALKLADRLTRAA